VGSNRRLGETNSRIKLQESVRRNRPKPWPEKLIHKHNSASAQDMLGVQEFLAMKSFTKMGHLPYSPDLVPCNCWLFPKLKNALKGQRFAGIPDIQCNMTLLEGITENNFQDCFRQWHHHLMKCIASKRRVFRRQQQLPVHR
jgi:hypothetical protein